MVVHFAGSPTNAPSTRSSARISCLLQRVGGRLSAWRAPGRLCFRRCIAVGMTETNAGAGLDAPHRPVHILRPDEMHVRWGSGPALLGKARGGIGLFALFSCTAEPQNARARAPGSAMATAAPVVRAVTRRPPGSPGLTASRTTIRARCATDARLLGYKPGQCRGLGRGDPAAAWPRPVRTGADAAGRALCHGALGRKRVAGIKATNVGRDEGQRPKRPPPAQVPIHRNPMPTSFRPSCRARNGG